MSKLFDFGAIIPPTTEERIGQIDAQRLQIHLSEALRDYILAISPKASVVEGYQTYSRIQFNFTLLTSSQSAYAEKFGAQSYMHSRKRKRALEAIVNVTIGVT